MGDGGGGGGREGEGGNKSSGPGHPVHTTGEFVSQYDQAIVHRNNSIIKHAVLNTLLYYVNYHELILFVKPYSN